MSELVRVITEDKPKDQIMAGDFQAQVYEKEPERHNAEDVVRELGKKACAKLEDIIQRSQDFADEYYVVLWLKIDPMLPSIVQKWWLGPLLQRPSPEFNWSLFSYSNKEGALKHHWTIPDLVTAHFLLQNAKKVPKEDRQLLEWVTKFKAGSLV